MAATLSAGSSSARIRHAHFLGDALISGVAIVGR
jgi:hypothetical protein